MSIRQCQCCGETFTLRPQTPNQTYCSKPTCQKDRRNKWNKSKMKHDPDYRENQQRVQRAWHDRNPGYWRNYRKERHQVEEPGHPGEKASTNGDASLFSRALLPGLYWIELVAPKVAGNEHAWQLKIIPK